MRTIQAFIILVLSGAASGCGVDAATDVTSLPELTAARDLRVGSADDPTSAFTSFRALEVAPDGRIYTVHRSENAIRLTAEDGAFVRMIGREGEGPGEFRGLLSIGIRADTLWAFDSNTHRFTLFSLDGELLRTLGFLVDLGDGTQVPPRPTGMLHDGSVYGSRPAFSHEIADGTLTETSLVRFDSAGHVVDTIAVQKFGSSSTWRLADPNSPRGFQSFRAQPFNEAPLVAISPIAAEVITVDRIVPRDGSPPTFRVTKATFDGDTVFSRAFPYVPLPIGDVADSLARDFASGLQRLTEQMRGLAPTFEHGVELARSTLHLPPHHPPVRALLPGRDGTIWLEREDDGSEIRAYWILDADGEPIGTVMLPRGFQIMAADRSHVWGSELDELDVPYIVRYTIGPTPSGR